LGSKLFELHISSAYGIHPHDEYSGGEFLQMEAMDSIDDEGHNHPGSTNADSFMNYLLVAFKPHSVRELL